MTAARQQQELQSLWSEPYGRFIAITAGLSLVWIIYKRKLLRAGELIWLIGMTMPLLRSFSRLSPRGPRQRALLNGSPSTILL